MALIEDHQAEVVHGILTIFIPGSQMLDSCYQYISIPVLSTPSRSFDAEIVSEVRLESVFGLLGSGIAIDEEQRTTNQTDRAQLGNDTSCGNRLPSSRRHLDVHALAACLSCTKYLRNGDALIISQCTVKFCGLRSE